MLINMIIPLCFVHSAYFLVSRLALCPYSCVSDVKVWAVADSKRQGFIGFKEFTTAMQVVLSILFVAFFVRKLVRV